MVEALVRMETPEERELAKYLAEIEARKLRAANLQDEIASLRIDLGRFEAEYHTIVGALFLELDRIRLTIRTYEEKIARLQANPTADPEQIAREVDESFRREHEDINEQQRENKRYEDAFQQERARPSLQPDDEVELHRLYRDLAKRFHPDLARTDDERARREPMMRRANAAMRDSNLEAMRAFLNEADITDLVFEARSIGDKLVWAIREIARLDDVIANLQRDLAALKTTDAFGLWQRQESGESVINLLQIDLMQSIRSAQLRLATLAAAYQHHVSSRSEKP